MSKGDKAIESTTQKGEVPMQKNDGIVSGISNRDDTPGEIDEYLKKHTDELHQQGSSPAQEKKATEELSQSPT